MVGFQDHVARNMGETIMPGCEPEHLRPVILWRGRPTKFTNGVQILEGGSYKVYYKVYKRRAIFGGVQSPGKYNFWKGINTKVYIRRVIRS